LRSYRRPYGGDDFAQKFPQPPEDEAEVVADGAHDGVDVVSAAAVQEVSAQVAVGFAMADDGFDGGSPPEFLPDLAVDAAVLAGFEDPAGLWRMLAAVAFVHIGPLDLVAGQRLGFLEHLPQGVTIVRIAGQGLGMEDELAALASLVGGGERDPGSSSRQALDTELIGFMRLSLADTLGLRGVPGI